MNEDQLIFVAKPYLDSCRPGDWNHALRVVKWVKELGAGREDLDTIVTAAYLHDIGWSGVIKADKVSLDKVLELEPIANANTEKFVKEVLEQLTYDEKSIQYILQLINATDKHEANSENEEIIVDADTLSKLCIEHLQEKFSPGSYDELIILWEKELPKRMKTREGKELYPKLLDKLKEELK